MAGNGSAAEGFRLVTFDLDGTLTTVHGWWVIAQAVHRESDYLESNRRFFSRAIGEDEHLQNLLDLAVGLSRREVERLLEATPKIADIGETVQALRALGLRAALLTHNPEYVCDWYRTRYGFDDAEGTDGTRFGPGDRIVSAGAAHADKVGGLAHLVERFGLPRESIVHVGDGWADAAIFRRVGGGIAFNTRLDEVAKAADAVVLSRSLKDVVGAIERLRPRAPVGDDRAPDEGSNR